MQLGLGSDRIVRTAFRCKVEETFTSVSEAAKIVKIGLKEKAGCRQSCYAKALLYFHATLIQNKHKTISDEGITVDFWFIKVHTSN